MKGEETESALKEYLLGTGFIDAYEALLLKLLAQGPPQNENIFNFAADEILDWRRINQLGANDANEASIVRVTGKKNINVMYDAGSSDESPSSDHHSDNDFVNNSSNDLSLVKNPSKGSFHNGAHAPSFLGSVEKAKSSQNGLLAAKNHFGKYESDSDGDYDMSRSSSIVRVKKQSGKKITESPLTRYNNASNNNNNEEEEDKVATGSGSEEENDTLQLSESVMSVSSVYDTLKSMMQGDSQRSHHLEEAKFKKSGSNKSVGSYRSSHSYHSDSDSDKEGVPRFSSFSSKLIQRSQSAKSEESNRSSSSATAIPKSGSMKSVGSNRSSPTISLENLQRGGGLDSPRSIPSSPHTPVTPTTPITPSYISRSESGKSVGSYRSGLAKSESAKSVASDRSVGLSRSESAKSMGSKSHSPHSHSQPESPCSKLETLIRSNSNRSMGSSFSNRSPRDVPESPRAILEDLIRSNSGKSVGSNYSKTESPREILESLIRSNSAKSMDSKNDSPRSEKDSLTKSESAKSVGSTGQPKKKQFLFTVTSDDNDDTTLLASAAMPSPSPSSAARALPLGSFAPSNDYLTRRRASAFTEEDVVKPDMKVINNQIENTYGSSDEEVEEEEPEEELEEELEEEYQEHRSDEEDSPRGLPTQAPLALNSLVPKDKQALHRRGSIFDEIAQLKQVVQFDDNIEDTYDIKEDPGSDILSNDGSNHEGDLEFEFEDRDPDTEEIEALEYEDEDFDLEGDEDYDDDDNGLNEFEIGSKEKVGGLDMGKLKEFEKKREEERNSARDSARSSARDSARSGASEIESTRKDTPRDSDIESDRGSARNSARNSARDSARGSARNSARSTENKNLDKDLQEGIQAPSMRIDMEKLHKKDGEGSKLSQRDTGRDSNVTTGRDNIAGGSGESARTSEDSARISRERRAPQDLSKEQRINSDLGSDYSPPHSPISSTLPPLMHPISSASNRSLKEDDYSDYEDDEELELENERDDKAARGTSFTNTYLNDNSSEDDDDDDDDDDDNDDDDDEYLEAMRKKFDPRQSHSDEDIRPTLANPRRGLTTKESDDELEDEGYGSDLDSTRRDLAELDYLDFKNPKRRKEEIEDEYESYYESDEM